MSKIFKKFIFVLLFTILCLFALPVIASNDKSYISKASGNGYVTYRGSNEYVEINSEYVYKDTEFRAVWVTALSGNVARFTSKDQYKKEILTVLDTMEYYNMNVMIFHIRIMNDAFYESKYNNWSIYYNTDPSWEALSWIIEECHNRGIEFHAWMNPYRVTNNVNSNLEELASEFPSNNPASNPDNLLVGENSIILNPGEPEVKEFLINTCMEVVQNYDVDAIHFDDYFYDKGVDDSETRKKYNTTNLSLGDFRRKQVNDFIQTLNIQLELYNKSNNKNVQLGISPSGVWQSGNGVVTYDSEGNAITTGSNTGANAFSHYDNYLYSDTLKWINEEWIDYILPQTYWAIEHATCPYADLMKWWNDVVKYKNVSLYSGMAVYQAYNTTSGSSWASNSLEGYNEAMICNTLENVSGISVYDYDYLERTILNSKKGFEKITEIWNRPIILPEIKGATRIVLDEITNLNAQTNSVGNLLTWDDDVDAKFYVIYRSEKPLTYDSSEVIDVIGHLTNNGQVSFTDQTAEEGKTYYYGVRSQSYSLTLNDGVSTILNTNETDELASLGDFDKFLVTDGIVPGSNINVRFNELSYPFGDKITYKLSYSFNDEKETTITSFDKNSNDFLTSIKVPYNANKIKIVLEAKNNIAVTTKIYESDIIKGLGKINGFTFNGKPHTGTSCTFSWRTLDEANVIYWIQISTDLVNWKNRDFVSCSGSQLITKDVVLPSTKGIVYYRVLAEKDGQYGYSDVCELDLYSHLGNFTNYIVNGSTNNILYVDENDGLIIEFDELTFKDNIVYTLYVSDNLEKWITAKEYNSKNCTVTIKDGKVVIKLPFTFEKMKLYFKVVASTNSSMSESDIKMVYIEMKMLSYFEVIPFLGSDYKGFINEMDIYN